MSTANNPDAPLALLLDNIHDSAAERLQKAGFAVHREGRLESVSDELLARVVLLGIRSRSRIDRFVLERMPLLVAIGAFGVGINQVDVAQATSRGVALFNAPYSNTRSVVELALGQMLALLRGSADRNREMHDGRWNKSTAGAREARGATLGIVGYGNVGSQLSVLAEALGMNVIYYDLAERMALGNARSCASMDALLEQSDIVSLHIDGGGGNRHIIGAPELAKIKPGGILMNLSRGSLVDTRALVTALDSGHLGGAALDVFDKEPSTNPAEFESPLRGMNNVILSPHIGGSTEQAQRSIAEYTPRRLLDYYLMGDTMGSVNLPQVRLAASQPGANRTLHLHRNEPGVLASINSIFAEGKCNIIAQRLKTDGELGYAITDIDQGYTRGLAESLAAVPGTIRFRVL